MGYDIILHPLAETEMWDATDWYDSQKDDLGKQFAAEMDFVVSAIQRMPNRFPLVFDQKRAALFRRFPYRVIFTIDDNTIIIIGIFHMHRHLKDIESR